MWLRVPFLSLLRSLDPEWFAKSLKFTPSAKTGFPNEVTPIGIRAEGTDTSPWGPLFNPLSTNEHSCVASVIMIQSVEIFQSRTGWIPTPLRITTPTGDVSSLNPCCFFQISSHSGLRNRFQAPDDSRVFMPLVIGATDARLGDLVNCVDTGSVGLWDPGRGVCRNHGPGADTGQPQDMGWGAMERGDGTLGTTCTERPPFPMVFPCSYSLHPPFSLISPLRCYSHQRSPVLPCHRPLPQSLHLQRVRLPQGLCTHCSLS